MGSVRQWAIRSRRHSCCFSYSPLLLLLFTDPLLSHPLTFTHNALAFISSHLISSLCYFSSPLLCRRQTQKRRRSSSRTPCSSSSTPAPTTSARAPPLRTLATSGAQWPHAPTTTRSTRPRALSSAYGIRFWRLANANTSTIAQCFHSHFTFFCFTYIYLYPHLLQKRKKELQAVESEEKRTLERLSLTGSAVKLLPESAADKTDAQLIRLSSTFSSSKPFDLKQNIERFQSNASYSCSFVAGNSESALVANRSKVLKQSIFGSSSSSRAPSANSLLAASASASASGSGASASASASSRSSSSASAQRSARIPSRSRPGSASSRNPASASRHARRAAQRPPALPLPHSTPLTTRPTCETQAPLSTSEPAAVLDSRAIASPDSSHIDTPAVLVLHPDAESASASSPEAATAPLSSSVLLVQCEAATTTRAGLDQVAVTAQEDSGRSGALCLLANSYRLGDERNSTDSE